jgi:hypothetical protein
VRRYRLTALIGGFLLAAGSLAQPAAATPDVTISNIEITQAVQTPTNTIRLVASKGTAVRVTLNTGGLSVPNITGRLHVFRNGVEITPAAGVVAINQPFTAPAVPQRANQNDTLNFELLAPTGILASTDVDFHVDVAVPGDPNPGNNSGHVNNLTFSTRRTPYLFFTRVNWCGTGLAPLSFVQAGTGDAFVRGILPVNDADPLLYRQGLFPTLSYCNDPDHNGILEALSPEGDQLLDFLEACRQLIVSSGFGASDRVFLYGWLNGNPIDGNGLARTPGRVAFGNSDPVRGQRSYAHELTHNFGFNHNSLNLDQVDWDVGGRLIGNPATNNVTSRSKPTTLFDIQVPGLLTNQAYIRSTNYNGLFDDPVLRPTFTFPFRPYVAILRGFFDPTGKELIRLDNVYRYPWDVQPTRVTKRTQPYVAVVTDVQGNVFTVPFSATNSDDPSERQEVELPGMFTVAIPVDPSIRIADVRITDATGETTFGEMRGSKASPKGQITFPNPGQALDKRVVMSWDVTDGDTPMNDLSYQIAWSWNGGKSFVPLGVDLPGKTTEFGFRTSALRRSAGNGLLRLFVSDGANTSFFDVSGLTL